MVSTGLHGPHTLRHDEIDRVVSQIGIGCYAMGQVNDNGVFVVTRIGRSDDNLNGRIHDYVGQYNQFKYGFLPTVQECYEHECRMWHDFKPKDNSYHPDKPTGTNYCCPVALCDR